MLILAFDTTAAAVSVVLWRDGAVIAERRRVMDQGQAEALVPTIEDVLGREQVEVDFASLAAYLKGQTVLVSEPAPTTRAAISMWTWARSAACACAGGATASKPGQPSLV